jgi:hypothetical protein
MKKISLFLLIAVIAALLAACGGAANSNSAANPNKTTAAMPTQDELLALDKKANQAWVEHDTKFFEYFLSDNFVMYGPHGRVDKAGAISEIAGHKCDVKTFNVDDVHMQMAGNDVAILVYKITYEGTCEGKKIPDARASTAFVRRFDEWKGAYHSETPIVAAAGGDKKPAAKPDDKKAEAKPDTKKDETAASTTTGKNPPNAKKDTNSATADVKPPADDKKAVAENKPSNANTATAAVPASNMKPSADPTLTESLLAVEKDGWNAWKDKDAKKLDEVTAKDVMFIDPAGMAYTDKVATLKAWAEPCTVTSVDVQDPYSVSVTTDVAILLYKGVAAGTCGNMKLSPIWGTSVFHSENGNWKAVLITEMPAM